MSFKNLQSFLSRLQKNNNKEWMDAHRKEYHTARDFFILWLDDMNDRLAQIDSDYFDTPGKKAINRINNNLMFHPNRPVYKDHFAAGLDQLSKQGDFYIEIGLEHCFIGGGYWHPSSQLLKSIREAIDYNGEALKAIIEKPSFVSTFGGMIEAPKLKQPPRGYNPEHPHIELLKMKTFAVSCILPKKLLLSAGFEEQVIAVYKELLPFRRYLNQAVTV